jgi:hypothetical protein
MPERPKPSGLKPYLIFGIVAATIEMAVVLWLLFR